MVSLVVLYPAYRDCHAGDGGVRGISPGGGTHGVLSEYTLEAWKTTEVCTLEEVTLMITLLMWRAIRGRYLETTEVCTLEGWTSYRSFAP